jgi:hypothetical protein
MSAYCSKAAIKPYAWHTAREDEEEEEEEEEEEKEKRLV